VDQRAKNRGEHVVGRVPQLGCFDHLGVLLVRVRPQQRYERVRKADTPTAGVRFRVADVRPQADALRAVAGTLPPTRSVAAVAPLRTQAVLIATVGPVQVSAL
jgi:hypothetical protein